MSDRRLQVFHAVAELKSFTRAGQRLHMTQPAVTFQIRQLEEQFNARLFDREHNRIELTAAGKRVQVYAERILATYAEMEASVRELNADMAGTLILGASMTIAEYDLPRVLVRFKRQFPEITVKLLASNTDGIIQMLADNRIDLGLVEGPIADRGLEIELYHMDQLVAVVPPEHPLANRDRVSAKDITGYPFIMREEGSGTREVVLEFLSGSRVREEDFDVVMELGSPEAIKGAVSAGLGISILSSATVRKELALGTLVTVQLDPPIERPFSFVYQRRKFPPPTVQEMLRFARESDQE